MACGEVRNLPGSSLGAKDAKKASVHSMNGLEGKRGKKRRQEGGEQGKGMAERGTEQWEGSSQPGKALHSTAAAFQVALQGKGVIWQKAGC